MKRLEAIALLREITSNRAVIPVWASLENAGSGGYELHIKPQDGDPTSLRFIVEEHNLEFKEFDGFWVIQGKRGVRKRLPRNQRLMILEQMG